MTRGGIVVTNLEFNEKRRLPIKEMLCKKYYLGNNLLFIMTGKISST